MLCVHEILPQHKELYSLHLSKADGFNNQPPGKLNLSRLLKNMTAWQNNKETTKYQPKTLVLTAWNLNNLNHNQYTKLIEKISLLKNHGFKIFFVYDYQLLEFNSDASNAYAVFNNIEPITPEDVYKAATNSNIPLYPKDTFILDEYKIQILLEEYSPDSRTLETASLEQLSSPSLCTLIETYKETPDQKPCRVLNTIYGKTNNAAQVSIQPLTLEIAITQANFFNKMYINSLELNDGNWIINGNKVDRDILSQIAHINITNEFTELNLLKKLINLMPHLTCITFTYLREKQDTFLGKAIIEMVAEVAINLKKLILCNLPHEDILDDYISQKSSLEVLYLEQPACSYSFLAYGLKFFPNLRKLIITECKFNNDETINFYNIKTKITELDLSGSTITLKLLIEILKAMPELEKLNLCECTILQQDSPTNLDKINLPKLKILYMSEAKTSYYNLIILLQMFPNLEQLDMHDIAPLEEEKLLTTQGDELIELYNLKSLKLPDTNEYPMTNNLLASIKLSLNLLYYLSLHIKDTKLPNFLTNLSLENIKHLNLQNSDNTNYNLVELLKGSYKLEALNISNNDNLDKKLPFDALNLSQLKRLDVSDSDISYNNLKRLLQAAPNVEMLSIIGCGNLDYLEDNDLHEILSKLTKLKYLEVSNYSGTYVLGLLNIAPNITLYGKDFEKNFINDINQNSLSFPNLYYLCIKDNISAECRQTLQDAAPNARIISSNFTIEYDTDSEEDDADLEDDADIEEDDPDVKDIPHNNKNYKTPRPQKDFKFQKLDPADKSQGPIKALLCRYLELQDVEKDIINAINEGICNALSKMFLDYEITRWNDFLKDILSWDGQQDKLNPLIRIELEVLYKYVQEHQLIQRNKQYYIGDNLEIVLWALSAQNSGLTLLNPWHTICVKFINEQYYVCDPNYVNGYKICSTMQEAINNIKFSLGNLIIVVDVDLNIPPIIPNKQDFLKEGGLAALIKAKNYAAILEQFSLINLEELNIDALKGILLFSSYNKPFWYIGLTCGNKDKIDFTKKLLSLLIQKASDAKRLLAKNLESLTEDEKKAVLEEIKFNPELNLISNLILYPPKPNEHYAKYFISANTAYEEGVEEFCANIFAKTKNILLDTTNTANVSWCLLEYARNESRAVFYVDSPDLLKCQIPYIDDNGMMQKGPSGALYNFITNNPDGIIVINYANFSPSEIVAANSILDKDGPKADGIALGSNMRVIALRNSKDATSYNGGDFLGRFSEQIIVPSCMEELKSPVIENPVIEDLQEYASRHEDIYGVNLYNSPDWLNILLGSWKISQDKLSFKEGALLAAIAQANVDSDKQITLSLLNAPLEQEDFYNFWHTSMAQGFICEGNKTIFIPQNLKFEFLQYYDYSKLEKVIKSIDISWYVEKEDTFILNNNTYSKFFEQYEINNEDKTLNTLPGILEQNKGKALSIYVTCRLAIHLWQRLIDESFEHNIKLNIHLSREVELPPELNAKLMIIENTHLNNLDGYPNIYKYTKPQIIVSNNYLAIIDNFVSPGEYLCIDISSYRVEDLLINTNAKFLEESLSLEFSQRACALIELLRAGKNIILTGVFSDELKEALEEFILRYNPHEFTGKLLIITYPCIKNTFNYQAIYDDRAEQIPAQKRLEEKLYKNHEYKIDLQEPENLSLADVGCFAKDFLANRVCNINKVLEESPFVVLEGPSGAGKTTIIKAAFPSETNKIFIGLDSVAAWAKDDSGERKILFIDEYNTHNEKYMQFAGLYDSKQPFIIVDGEYIALTAGHKVVFAGNKACYGNRNKPLLVERYGNILEIKPLAWAVILHEILLPLLKDSYEDEGIRIVTQRVLEIYNYIVSISEDELLISPRELEAIVMYVRAHMLEHKQDRLAEVVEYYSYEICKNVIPARYKHEFARKFHHQDRLEECKKSEDVAMDEDTAVHEDTAVYEDTVMDEDDAISEVSSVHAQGEDARPQACLNTYIELESRKDIINIIKAALRLRKMRIEGHFGVDRETKDLYAGLGAISLEGPPGVGKSELLKHVLLGAGYEEARDYIFLPSNMDYTQKQALLINAFNDGMIVIADEFNTSFIDENLINELLMGRHNGIPPARLGFSLLTTQNPSSMEGRMSISKAIQRRSINLEVCEYTNKDLKEILKHLGLEAEIAEKLLQAYNAAIIKAKGNNTTPPTFRQLLNAVEAELDIARTENAAKKGYETWQNEWIRIANFANLGIFHPDNRCRLLRNDNIRSSDTDLNPEDLNLEVILRKKRESTDDLNPAKKKRKPNVATNSRGLKRTLNDSSNEQQDGRETKRQRVGM